METIHVRVDEEMMIEIEKRADSMHLFTSEYCSLILNEWITSGDALELTECC